MSAENRNFIPDLIVTVPTVNLVVRSREHNDWKITIVNQKYPTLQRGARASNRLSRTLKRKCATLLKSSVTRFKVLRTAIGCDTT